MRILFLGTPQFAVPSLEALFRLDQAEMAGVITQPDKPGGRHLAIVSPPVKKAASGHGLLVYQPNKVSHKEFIDSLKGTGIDLIVTVSFGEILNDDVLALPKIGCINLHPSLLPKYRGASPVAGALLSGEQITGVTTFWLSARMDSGDIILQKQAPILPGDTRGVLEERLAGMGALLIVETVIRINNGTAPREKQDESGASYTYKIKKKDGLIDWKETATRIHNKIRAMDPWPGAYTHFNKSRIEIWKSELREEEEGPAPGAIKLINKDVIGVGTGKGLLLIKELQVEGKKRQRSGDFINGYRITNGQMFASGEIT